jgi:hypothetical protein
VMRLPALLISLGLLAGCKHLNGFEHGDFRGWIPEFPESYSGQIVEAPVRCGQYAARFEWRPGDIPWTGGYRAEINEYYVKATQGQPLWYAFSSWIPASWQGEAVITQWHATPDPGEVWRSPPLALRYDGDRLRVTARTSPEPIQRDNDAPEWDLYVDDQLPTEEWNDWVFRVVWSWEQDGSVAAWLNGVKVIDYIGPIGYNDIDGTYFKFGIYNQGVSFIQVIFHDEYRRGKTPSAVIPPC